MNFWSKLFRTKEIATTNLSDAKPVSKSCPPTNKNELLLTIFESVKELGHSENLLLRKEYDLNSRMPSSDFSIWLINKFKNKDYESIWAFVKELYGNDEDPGGGINVDEMMIKITTPILAKKYGMSVNETNKELVETMKSSEFTENSKNHKSRQKQLFESFLSKDLNTYIESDEKVIYEIQSFFILKSGMDDFMRGFWIGEGSVSETLSKVLCVYDFSIKLSGFETLVLKANKFLKEMKKEEKDVGSYGGWELIPYFKVKDLKKSFSIESKTDIQKKLQSLGLGERLHFFDFASSNTFSQYWSGNSSYKTRSVGVCEKESIKKMVELNLFTYTNDIESILDISNKGELKDQAEKNGFELKKSWNLQKIYEYLLKSEEGKIFLQNFSQEKRGLKFNHTYKDDLFLFKKYQEQIKKVSSLLSMI
jgi:hypothetical protein